MADRRYTYRRDVSGDPLSPREREVLALAAAEQTNDQIARSLGISTQTVKNHVGLSCAKLGAGSRLGAPLAAVRTGQLDVPGILPADRAREKVRAEMDWLERRLAGRP